MAIRQLAVSSFLLAAISACAGRSVTPEEPPPVSAPPPTGRQLSIALGDGQTVVQHSFCPDDFVAVVKDDGVGVPGLLVTFTAAPDSAYFQPAPIRTDTSGEANLDRPYIHGAGEQHIVAAVPDDASVPPATLTIHVTASPDRFDGYWVCGGSATFNVVGTQLALGDVINPLFGSLNVDDGTFSASRRQSLDNSIGFEGTLVIEDREHGTGSITATELYHGAPASDAGPGAPTPCERQ